MKSATCSRPGAAARKSRFTRSGHRAAAGSATVVRAVPARVLPRHPFARISRATVHRAAVMPCRRSRYAWTFTAPYSDSGLRRPRSSGSKICASSPVTRASDSARAEAGLVRRAQYVRGAIFMPCAVSARQIGTTPNRSRAASMNLQISAVAAGRAPGRKNLSPPSGSRWSAAARLPCGEDHAVLSTPLSSLQLPPPVCLGLPYPLAQCLRAADFSRAATAEIAAHSEA